MLLTETQNDGGERNTKIFLIQTTNLIYTLSVPDGFNQKNASYFQIFIRFMWKSLIEVTDASVITFSG